MKDKRFQIAFYSVMTILIAVLTYFIFANAEWLIGDDAIEVEHTGWGHPFRLGDMVSPAIGRFYPLAYFAYNIVWLFGGRSPLAHFSVMAVFFVLMVGAIFFIVEKAVEQKGSIIWRYIAVFAIAAICIQRAYSAFLYVFSTAWFAYALIVFFAVCCYLVHTKQSISAAIIGFLIATFTCYCGEECFVIFLSYGVIGLIFQWRTSSKLEKGFLWSLIATTLIFLILYYFICFIHIETAYDGAHGSDVTLLGNAFKMFIAQKVLWLGVVVLLWRMYCVFIKKESYEFWDTMIVAGFGFVCGCFILKLNWVLYYNIASLFMMPALGHYVYKYLDERLASIILIILAAFMCRTIPKYIIRNQKERKGSTIMWQTFKEHYQEGRELYWFAPENNNHDEWDWVLRDWLYHSTQTLAGWYVGEEDLCIEEITSFQHKPGIYFIPKQNDTLFPSENINDSVLNHCVPIMVEKTREIKMAEIQ